MGYDWPRAGRDVWEHGLVTGLIDCPWDNDSVLRGPEFRKKGACRSQDSEFASVARTDRTWI